MFGLNMPPLIALFFPSKITEILPQGFTGSLRQIALLPLLGFFSLQRIHMQKPLIQDIHFLLRSLTGFFNPLELFSFACFRVLFHTRNTPGILTFQSFKSHRIQLRHISMTAATSFMGLTSFSKLSSFFVESILVLILPSCPYPYERVSGFSLKRLMKGCPSISSLKLPPLQRSIRCDRRILPRLLS